MKLGAVVPKATLEQLYYLESDPRSIYEVLKQLLAKVGPSSEGTPVNAVASTATLTFTGAVTDGETVTIGDSTYEFDTDEKVEEGNISVDVSLGSTSTDAVAALVSSIEANESSLVTSVDGEGDTVVVTSKIKGKGSNSIPVATDCVGGSWGEDVATLSGGVDGTLGNKGDIKFDTTYLYLCVADNATSDTNWRRISLGDSY